MLKSNSTSQFETTTLKSRNSNNLHQSAQLSPTTSGSLVKKFLSKSPRNRENDFNQPDPAIKPPKNAKEAENFENLPMEFRPVDKSQFN